MNGLGDALRAPWDAVDYGFAIVIGVLVTWLLIRIAVKWLRSRQ